MFPAASVTHQAGSQHSHDQERCKGSGGTVNMFCQLLQFLRCSIRFLTSGNGRKQGVDNGCCPNVVDAWLHLILYESASVDPLHALVEVAPGTFGCC
jgi:hypothetical protein